MFARTGKDVRDRIKLMYEQVGKSLRWPYTRTLAVQMILAANCPSQNLGPYSHDEIDECQVNAIYWGLKSHGLYIGDTVGLDTYQTLQRTYELGLHPSPILAESIGAYANAMHEWYNGAIKTLDRQVVTENFVYDCDDAVIALCSLLGSIGFKSGAKAISEDGQSYNHVYGVVELPRMSPSDANRRIVPLDITEYEAYPGWEPPPQSRVREMLWWYGERS